EARGNAIAGLVQHAAHFALGGFDLGGARQRQRRDALLGARRRFSSATVRVDDLRQRALAAGAHRDGRHHRHTERTLERRAVERIAALRAEVAHVEGDVLAAASQTVEERSLAAVGDADEREGELRRGQRRGRGGVHRSSSTLLPEPPGASWGSALVPECCSSTPFAAPATRAWGGAPDSEWCNSTPFAVPATRAWGGASDSECCNSTHTLCASRPRSASVVLPTRTTTGSRPARAAATDATGP